LEPGLADMSVISYCFISFLLSTSYSAIKWDRRILSAYDETEMLIMGDVSNPQKNTFLITFYFLLLKRNKTIHSISVSHHST
jgi:hypothetical protein